MSRLDVTEEIEKKFSLLKSVANIYILKDDKSFCGAYCDFLDRLRRKSGISVQLCVFRPEEQEVYFGGDQRYAAKLSKSFGGCFKQEWRDIYGLWMKNKELTPADIVTVLLYP